jgi:ketosteroid isomerase-like protein
MIPDVHRFVQDWCAAWNRHDVEAVLDHFHEDVIFTSPVAQRVVPETIGVVQGKPALRDYWMRALEMVPDLHFTIIGVYSGVDAVVIHYRNQRGVDVCEVLVFGGELVRRGYGTYNGQVSDPAAQ